MPDPKSDSQDLLQAQKSQEATLPGDRSMSASLAAQHRQLGELMLASAQNVASDPQALARVKKKQF
jgi:hypothetical protein